jgi:hypothetical protein
MPKLRVEVLDQYPHRKHSCLDECIDKYIIDACAHPQIVAYYV